MGRVSISQEGVGVRRGWGRGGQLDRAYWIWIVPIGSCLLAIGWILAVLPHLSVCPKSPESLWLEPTTGAKMQGLPTGSETTQWENRFQKLCGFLITGRAAPRKTRNFYNNSQTWIKASGSGAVRRLSQDSHGTTTERTTTTYQESTQHGYIFDNEKVKIEINQNIRIASHTMPGRKLEEGIRCIEERNIDILVLPGSKIHSNISFKYEDCVSSTDIKRGGSLQPNEDHKSNTWRSGTTGCIGYRPATLKGARAKKK